jgi:CRISPR-associated endoribonuclease Cas6
MNMRLHLSLSATKTTVPFDHLPMLAGALHKWAGPNYAHDEVSLYSFSWLKGGSTVPNGKGLRFPSGAEWFISCYDEVFAKQITLGLMADPVVNYGLEVRDVGLQETPSFGGSQLFRVASPVLIKQRREDGTLEHCLYDHPQADTLLTKVLQTKLKKAGLSDPGAKITFARDYGQPRSHKVIYRGIANRASTCPVQIEGQPQTLAFAWEVGVGYSTGIGFGSLY